MAKDRRREVADIEASDVILASGIAVVDATRASVIDQSVQAWAQARARERAVIATAIHVGGLNARRSEDYRRALAGCELRYADGMAAVLVARLAGARHIERAATTDIGLPIIEGISELKGEPVKLVLIGGPPGLAELAGARITSETGATILGSYDGFGDVRPGASTLGEIREAKPDVILLGLGAPAETILAHRWLRDLPPCLVLTCGGWFGFLAGQERRAPSGMQRLGLEWLFRISQSPVRLIPRYAEGAVSTLVLSARALLGRLSGAAE